MFECLASVMIGNPVIAPSLEGKLSQHTINAACLAIDIAALGSADAFGDQIDRLVADIKGLPRADGVDEILLPGERGDRVMAERRERGIPVPEGTRTRLTAIAAGLGVEMPAALAG